MINILKTSDEGLDNIKSEFEISFDGLISVKVSSNHIKRDVKRFLNNQEGKENEANLIKGIADNIIADWDNSYEFLLAEKNLVRDWGSGLSRVYDVAMKSFEDLMKLIRNEQTDILEDILRDIEKKCRNYINHYVDKLFLNQNN